MSYARAGPSLCWTCTAEECCGLGWGRQRVWRGVGWGGGGLVEGGSDLGSWGKEGEGGVCQGHFWHISGPFQSASRLPSKPRSCLRPGSAAEPTAGRRRKRRAPPPVCRNCCGSPFASGGDVEAFFSKKDDSHLFASCREGRCVIAAAPSARLKKKLRRVLRQAAGVCVRLGHRRYAVMSVYMPRAALRVFGLSSPERCSQQP